MSSLGVDPSIDDGPPAAECEGSSAPVRPSEGRPWVVRWVVGHPIITVALLAALVGVVNLAWAIANRQPGGLDVDEVSYLTQAFGWQRTVDPTHPFDLYRAVLHQDKAPVTMLVSVVALLVGPNSVGAALAASAFLHGVSAVAVAAIANRLAGARAALVAGLVALALPAAIVAARSYQLAPAVGASLALAVWSLLASDRGRRLWPMAAFGASVGLLLLSRTMAVSFVPGLVVAGLVHLDRTRVTVRNGVASVAVALVIAGPWWIAQRASISDYLFGHGYGDAAEGYGPATFGGRAAQRWLDAVDGVGLPLIALGAVVIVAAVVRGARRADRSALFRSVRSDVAVVWITVALGYAALMSTANIGMYFDLPLLILAVAGVVGLAARLPHPLPHRAGSVAVAVALVTLLVSVTDTGGRRDGPGVGAAVQRAVFVGLSHYQRTTIEAEPRLDSPDRQIRGEAMEEWWEASRDVLRYVDAVVRQEPVMVTSCGSGPQISAGTLTLAGELDHRLRDSWGQWLSTSAPPAVMESELQPRTGDTPRVVVIIDSESPPFPGEASAERCARTAARLGWRTTSQVDLPDGGTVDVKVHPDNE